jgi:NitT/TauT family transport system substrate-binding protein
MHERDLEQRPEWAQKVVDAIVDAQIWTHKNRGAAAELLSKSGPNRYTPHEAKVLARVLNLTPAERQTYVNNT